MKVEGVKIESGIPCPPRKRSSKWRKIAESMRPGDSVQLGLLDARKLYSLARKIGVDVRWRRLEEEGQFRIWRL